MGVNIFIPINGADATPANVEKLVNLANEWADVDDDEGGLIFDWCDLHKGSDGWLLTMQQALSFEPDAAPWYVVLPDAEMTLEILASETASDLQRYSEFFWCCNEARFENNQTSLADWQALLRESGKSHVLFLKARN